MTTATFSTTPTTDRPWVHEMVIIHRAFRRELTLLPRLVREVGDGDLPRAATLAAAVRLVLGGLHHHHTGEDVVLWPALLERGLLLVGIDVLGDFLTEVNVTSPTGLVEIDLLDLTSVEARVLEMTERLARSRA